MKSLYYIGRPQAAFNDLKQAETITMQQLSDEDKTSKKESKTTLEALWNTPLGKVGLAAAGLLGFMMFMAAAFKVGAFTMNAYKDFRDANRR